jgi:hypothetical protein
MRFRKVTYPRVNPHPVTLEPGQKVGDTYVSHHGAYDVGQFLLPVFVGEVVFGHLLAHGEIPQFQELDISVLGDETLSGFVQSPILENTIALGRERRGRGASSPSVLS